MAMILYSISSPSRYTAFRNRMVQNIKWKFPLGEEENWNTNSPSQVFPHDVSAVVLNKACQHLGSSNFPGTEETVHKFYTMPLNVSWGHSMFNLSRYPHDSGNITVSDCNTRHSKVLKQENQLEHQVPWAPHGVLQRLQSVRKVSKE